MRQNITKMHGVNTNEHPKTLVLDCCFFLVLTFVDLENLIKGLEAEKAFSQAFDYSEQLLLLAKHNSPTSFSEQIPTILQRACQYSTELLNQNKPAESLSILKKAESIFCQHESIHLLPVTCTLYSNMVTTYKKCGKLQAALKVLDTALALCQKYNDTNNTIRFCLSASALLSQAKSHKAALDKAKLAAAECEEKLLSLEIELRTNSNAKEVKVERNEAIALLSVAYYNIGVQHEYLANYKSALQWYNKARSTIDPNSATQRSLKESIERAIRQVLVKCRNGGREVRADFTELETNKTQQIRPKSAKIQMFFKRPQHNDMKKLYNETPNISFKRNDKTLQNCACKTEKSRTRPVSRCARTMRGSVDLENLKVELQTMPRQKVKVVEVGFYNTTKNQKDSFEEHDELDNMGLLKWDDSGSSKIRIFNSIAARKASGISYITRKHLKVNTEFTPEDITTPSTSKTHSKISIHIKHSPVMTKSFPLKSETMPAQSKNTSSCVEKVDENAPVALDLVDSKTISENGNFGKVMELMQVDTGDIMQKVKKKTHAALMIQKAYKRHFQTEYYQLQKKYKAKKWKLVYKSIYCNSNNKGKQGNYGIVLIKHNAVTGMVSLQLYDYKTKRTVFNVVQPIDLRYSLTEQVIRKAWEDSTGSGKHGVLEESIKFFNHLKNLDNEATHPNLLKFYVTDEDKNDPVIQDLPNLHEEILIIDTESFVISETPLVDLCSNEEPQKSYNFTINSVQYHLEVQLSNGESTLVLSESTTSDKQKIPLSYLKHSTAKKEKELIDRVITWLIHKKNNETKYDITKLHQYIKEYTESEVLRNITIIQRTVKKWLAKMQRRVIKLKEEKEWKQVLVQGLKVNGVYQLVKVLMNQHDMDRIIIFSSKATNKQKFKLSNLIPQGELGIKRGEWGELKRLFRYNLAYFIEYDGNSRKIQLMGL
eukprot:TRINITY_DN3992_c0_g1_i1.p1 TRINITY_DN3992_c0_g1~~TRINITY_DN3992_c0_g1_i1.p1  ORF type:complete len:938 (+),score=86.99 TRINITY_DN3992_c0_g1_i1:3569-6382(+)